VTGRSAHTTTSKKLQWLEKLRDQSEHHGSEAVEKHRDAGKLLARERAERLCDPGSFVEPDRYVRHREAHRSHRFPV
jgi:acetyl-CoA carboxylase carboxyltransferase component